MEAAALAVGGMAFPNGDREALPLLVAWVEKLREALETGVTAGLVFVPVLAMPRRPFTWRRRCWPPCQRRCLRLWPDANLGRRWR